MVQQRAGTAALGYRPELDGLRALAVTGVFACHATPQWVPAGWIGVDLFFVLSGFLITRLLLEEHATSGIDLPAFWRRRARRLMPAFLVVAVVFSPWVDGLGWVFGYASNVARVQGIGLGPLGHLWSLAVEEQFYLVWPLVLVVLLRYRVQLAPAIGFAIVAVTAWRALLFDAGTNRVYFATDTRADALLIGCLVAVVLPRIRWRTPYGWASGAVMLLIAATGPKVGPGMDPYYTPVAVAAAGCVIAALHDRPRWLTTPWLLWIGRRSYGIYLWHWPVIWWLGDRPAIAAAATLTVAAASYRWVEGPFRSAQPVAGHHRVRVRHRDIQVPA